MITHILAAGGGGTNLDADWTEAAFWVLAVLAVGAAFTMICTRQAVHCALLLAVVMLSLAVMYAMQAAPFLALVQVVVYTGAVLMLFLFVMMLIGVSSADSLRETIAGQRVWAGIGALAFMVLLIVAVGHAALGSAPPTLSHAQASNLTGLSKLIWTKEQLLAPLNADMEAPPHPMRLGNDEKDYYRLGGAGIAQTPRAPGMTGPGGASGPAMEATATDERVPGEDEVKPGAQQVSAGGSEASR